MKSYKVTILMKGASKDFTDYYRWHFVEARNIKSATRKANDYVDMLAGINFGYSPRLVALKLI